MDSLAIHICGNLLSVVSAVIPSRIPSAVLSLDQDICSEPEVQQVSFVLAAHDVKLWVQSDFKYNKYNCGFFFFYENIIKIARLQCSSVKLATVLLEI